MVILHSPNRFSIKKIVQIFSHSQKLMAKKLMSFTPINQYSIPTQKIVCGTVIKGHVIFLNSFGHLIKYSSDKMIESGFREHSTLLPYANINIKFVTSCAFRGKPAMKTYHGYTDNLNELMVTDPMFGEFQPTNSCHKNKTHLGLSMQWDFPLQPIF